jgi:hypothetical protein
VRVQLIVALCSDISLERAVLPEKPEDKKRLRHSTLSVLIIAAMRALDSFSGEVM